MKYYLCLLTLIVSNVFAAGQATLENPSLGSTQSGVAIISGWACDATAITLKINDQPLFNAAYGTPRADTESVCGDVNNGFGALVNWNSLGDGSHTLSAFADGDVFATISFTVRTLGSEFLRDLSISKTITNFPEINQTATLEWSTAHQNFVISGGGNASGGISGDATHQLENPQPGAKESGITLVSGWACQATAITLQIDNNAEQIAGYGTSRVDTESICKDTNNGFALTVNYNALTPGEHVMKAFADGVEFANVIFNTANFGSEFISTLVGEFVINNFPESNRNTKVSWSTPQQNFIVSGDSRNNAQNLLGKWRVETVDDDPLPVFVAFVDIEFLQSGAFITSSLQCEIDIAYVSDGTIITATTTRLMGALCPSILALEGVANYSIAGDLLTIIIPNTEGTSNTAVFKKL